AEAVQEAEAVRVAEAVQEAEAVRVAEAVQEAEAARVAKAVQEAEAARVSEAVQEAEAARVAKAVQEAEAERVAEAVQEAKPRPDHAASSQQPASIQAEEICTAIAEASKQFLARPSIQYAEALKRELTRGQGLELKNPELTTSHNAALKAWTALAQDQLNMWDRGFSEQDVQAVQEIAEMQSRTLHLELESFGAASALGEHIDLWEEAANEGAGALEKLMADRREQAIFEGWTQSMARWEMRQNEKPFAPEWMQDRVDAAQLQASEWAQHLPSSGELKVRNAEVLATGDPETLLLEVAFPSLADRNDLPRPLVESWVARVAQDKKLARALDRLKRDQRSDASEQAVSKRTASIRGLALESLALSFEQVHDGDDPDQVAFMVETVREIAADDGDAQEGVELLLSWSSDHLMQKEQDADVVSASGPGSESKAPVKFRVEQPVLGHTHLDQLNRLSLLESWVHAERALHESSPLGALTPSLRTVEQRELMAIWSEFKALELAMQSAETREAQERLEVDLFFSRSEVQRLAFGMDWHVVADAKPAAVPEPAAVPAAVPLFVEPIDRAVLEVHEEVMIEAGRGALIFLKSASSTPLAGSAGPEEVEQSTGLTLHPVTWERAVLDARSSLSEVAPSSAANRAILSVDDTPLKNGTVYKVQVGAFRQPVPVALFRAFDPMWSKKLANGITRYMAGSFEEMGPAVQARDAIRDLGYSDAFVVKYVDGQRVALSNALSAEPSTSVAVQNSTVAVKTPAVSAPTAVVDAHSVAPDLPRWSDRNGRWFSVQIGAFKGVPDRSELLDVLELTGENAGNDGWLRLFSGRFETLALARTHLEQLQSSGRSDAFVVAYENGVRVALFSAAQQQQQLRPVGGVVVLGVFSGQIPVDLANFVLLAPSDWGIRGVQVGETTRYQTRRMETSEEVERILKQAQEVGFELPYRLED
ncbi:MAG: SPOR domain-containing protein, partial [Flavobacteriales bacterium]|nr:SPOR domain-containing protein [Flavobacteriales bacterium]